jgi:hypothetical protein
MSRRAGFLSEVAAALASGPDHGDAQPDSPGLDPAIHSGASACFAGGRLDHRRVPNWARYPNRNPRTGHDNKGKLYYVVVADEISSYGRNAGSRRRHSCCAKALDERGAAAASCLADDGQKRLEAPLAALAMDADSPASRASVFDQSAAQR